MKVGIVNYQASNMGSLESALNQLEVDFLICETPEEISKSDLVILPGVGSFSSGIQNIRNSGMEDSILSHVRTERPLIGICLGMHLLATVGFEGGETMGLNLIHGEIKKLESGQTLRTPHMGWDFIQDSSGSSYAYFAHSYYFDLIASAEIELVSTYIWGDDEYPAHIRFNNVSGIQYHPEKSGKKGLETLAFELERFK